MKNSISGLSCLLTGAGGGIGRTLAERLASKGVNMALCGRNAQKLDDVKAVCKKYGVKAVSLAGDLTDENYLANCVDKAYSALGGLDILINNAGQALSKPFETVSLAEYDSIMDTNARAPFILCQNAVKYLLKSKQATIINICSVGGHKGYALQSVYTMSKHALLGMTRVIANELYEKGVRVHAISPGGVYTDLIRIARPDLTDEGMITTDDIADIAEFLLEHRTNAVIDEVCLHRVAKAPFA
ncbi:MAG: SDR family oxidoreductase [Clostridia bacterium]|nr:SDR family oxidoreductase [Clostridia bacterium]